MVYRGHAIFVSKALESSCAPSLHQCPGQPSLRLHRRRSPCTLRGGRPPSPQIEMEEENAQAPERVVRKDTSAGKGRGERNQGKKSLNKTRQPQPGAGPRKKGRRGSGEEDQLLKQTGRWTARLNEAFSRM